MLLRLVRLLAASGALLVFLLAFMPWIGFPNRGVTLYGPEVDVVFSFGDGFAVAAVGLAVLVSRAIPIFWPRLWAVFPGACVTGGLVVMSISAAVIFKDWTGDRRWPLFGELALGILLATTGGLLAGLWAREGSSRGIGGAPEASGP